MTGAGLNLTDMHFGIGITAEAHIRKTPKTTQSSARPANIPLGNVHRGFSYQQVMP